MTMNKLMGCRVMRKRDWLMYTDGLKNWYFVRPAGWTGSKKGRSFRKSVWTLVRETALTWSFMKVRP